MVPKPGLHLHVFGVRSRTGLKLIRSLLKVRVETASDFPTKRAAYSHQVRTRKKEKERNRDAPCRALSSEYSLATSSNLAPLRNFSSASSFFENFSHYFSSISLEVDTWKIAVAKCNCAKQYSRERDLRTRICLTLIDVAGFKPFPPPFPLSPSDASFPLPFLSPPLALFFGAILDVDASDLR